MSETRYRPPEPMQLSEFVGALANEQLHHLPLPDITESPFDTTGPESLWAPLPDDVRDIRECAYTDFEGWQPRDIIRGTFTLSVSTPPEGASRKLNEKPLVTATAESFIIGKDGLSRHNILDPALASFTVDTDHLDVSALAALSNLGRLQVVADLAKGDQPGNARLGEIHAVQRPHTGEAPLYTFHPTVIQGTINRFFLDGQYKSAGVPREEYHGRWFEVMVTNPDTGQLRPVRVEWPSANHNYTSSGWANDFAPYPVGQPMIGDTVQATCFIESLPDGSQRLHSRNATMHLLGGAPDQFEKTFAIESDLTLLEEFAKLEMGPEFCEKAGTFMRAHLEPASGATTRCTLAPHQLQRFEQVIATYNKDCAEHGFYGNQYVGWSIDHAKAGVLAHSYGLTDIYQATRQGVGNLGKNIAGGTLRPAMMVCDSHGTMLFEMLDAHNKPAADATARLAITKLYDIAVGEEASAQPHHETHDVQILYAALQHLPKNQDTEAMHLELLQMAAKVFDADAKAHPVNQALQLPVLSALCDALKGHTKQLTEELTNDRKVSAADRQNREAMQFYLPVLLGDMRNHYRRTGGVRLLEAAQYIDYITNALSFIGQAANQGPAKSA